MKKIIVTIENLLYIVAGFLAIKSFDLMAGYARSTRRTIAVGGEFLAPIVLYFVLYFVIRYASKFLQNRSEKMARLKEIKKSSCNQATASILADGTCVVLGRNGKEVVYNNFSEYLKTL